jgi:hypothetical protein
MNLVQAFQTLLFMMKVNIVFHLNTVLPIGIFFYELYTTKPFIHLYILSTCSPISSSLIEWSDNIWYELRNLNTLYSFIHLAATSFLSDSRICKYAILECPQPMFFFDTWDQVWYPCKMKGKRILLYILIFIL